MVYKKQIHIIGGGTISDKSTPHLALCAPAYGTTARMLNGMYNRADHNMEVRMHLTRMADPKSSMETNKDVEDLIDKLVKDETTKIVVMNAALCDFSLEGLPDSRLSSSTSHLATLVPADKVVNKIRSKRKDIFLVAFKTTYNDSPEEMFRKGLTLMKKSSANLVFVNDIGSRTNFIITPEEATYGLGKERHYVLEDLVEMSILRSQLSFTRSTVVDAEPVPWNDSRVPLVLRETVNYCIESGAYKEGPTGATVGHFAVKIDDTTFLTSRRKVNFNRMDEVGLVLVETDGPDSVIAYGSKPSVGGQSQRIVFKDHAGCDSIVHFHCPLKDDHLDSIPVVSQREYECGSHECGENTSKGLKKFGNIWAVMLDKHGPNIVFDSNVVTTEEVVTFINRNFDLSKKTTGL